MEKEIKKRKRYMDKKTKQPKEYIERCCLYCGSVFMADGRFIRSCSLHRNM